MSELRRRHRRENTRYVSVGSNLSALRHRSCAAMTAGAASAIRAVKRLQKLAKGTKVFSQGMRADAIYFIVTGSVKVTVLSAYGKEALLRTLGPNDFFGEECLIGHSLRTSTAESLGPSTIFRIEKKAMLQALHLQSEFSRTFLVSLLQRNLN